MKDEMMPDERKLTDWIHHIEATYGKAAIMSAQQDLGITSLPDIYTSGVTKAFEALVAKYDENKA